MKKVFPDVMLQWEDFAEHHAHLLLDRYRDDLCTFNDDIQGTATVAMAAVLSGLRQTDRSIRDQKIVIVGAGSAGSGIAEQLVLAMMADGLSDAEARERFYLVDRPGLLTSDMPDLEKFQVPLAQSPAAVADWTQGRPGDDEPARRRHQCQADGDHRRHRRVRPLHRGRRPGDGRRQRGADHPAAVEPDVDAPRRPPRTCSRGPTARRSVATGSPFKPVELNGVTYTIAQSNNSYIFPGVGLGVRASKATRVSDEMFMAAATALAASVDAQKPGDSLLPPLTEVRDGEPQDRHRRRACRRRPTATPRAPRPRNSSG